MSLAKLSSMSRNIVLGKTITLSVSATGTYNQSTCGFFTLYKFTDAGTITFNIDTTVNILLVGGGGGGGCTGTGGVGAGGGGSGGVVVGTIKCTANLPLNIVIGTGGAKATTSIMNGGTGNPSSIKDNNYVSLTANGGGGGSVTGPTPVAQCNGGSGGGAVGSNNVSTRYGGTNSKGSSASTTGYANVQFYGNDGGTNIKDPTTNGGGGGGGAGSAGSTSVNYGGGNGGDGYTWSINNTIYACGGAGVRYANNASYAQGVGGSGGVNGGAGGGGDGNANTGTGGGGNTMSVAAGNGGSGICIIALNNYYNSCTSLTGWTNSNFSIGTVGGQSCITSSTSNAYCYIDTGLSSFKNRTISFNVYLTGGCPDFFIGCNASGAGQALRFEQRGSPFWCGFMYTTTWTNWSMPTDGTCTWTQNTWVKVAISVNSSGVATFSMDGVVSGVPYTITDNGGYIGLQVDGGGGSISVRNINIY